MILIFLYKRLKIQKQSYIMGDLFSKHRDELQCSENSLSNLESTLDPTIVHTLENNNFSYILTLPDEILYLILSFLITPDSLSFISSNSFFWNKNNNIFFIQEKKQFLDFTDKLKNHFSTNNLEIMHRTGLIRHMNNIRTDIDSEYIRAIWNRITDEEKEYFKFKKILVQYTTEYYTNIDISIESIMEKLF